MDIYEKLLLLKYKSCPVRFESKEGVFVVEIQYYPTAKMQSQQDIDNGYFVFAVNTDGFDMIIDMKSKSEMESKETVTM